MNTSVINIKTNSEIKAQAQQVAEELGFNLSSLINAYLKQLVKTKTVTFSVSDETPTEYFLNMLKESKKDIEKGEISPTFSTADDAINWLKK